MAEINKKLVRQRFGDNIKTYRNAAEVQQYMAEQLTAKITDIFPSVKFDRVLEIGSGSGFLTEKIVETLDFKELFCNDLVTGCAKFLPVISNMTFLPGDAEKIILPDNLSMVISNATIQWLNHPRDFVRQLCVKLNNDGILAFTTFSPANFTELRQLLPQSGLNYPSLEEWREALNDLYVIPWIQEEQIIRYFDTPLQVLKHLQATGVTGVNEHRWTKRSLAEFSALYQDKFSNAEHTKVSLTYSPISIIAAKRKTPGKILRLQTIQH